MIIESYANALFYIQMTWQVYQLNESLQLSSGTWKSHHSQTVLHLRESTIKRGEYSAGFFELLWFNMQIIIPTAAPYSLIKRYKGHHTVWMLTA
jgi:hypothetical protein